MGLFQILGKLANQKGHENENRIFQAFENSVFPDWLKSISKTPDSFPNVDFIIDTDIGPIYLQVKSSQQAKLEFKDKLGSKSRNIACVVIKSKDTEEMIRSKVLSSVGELRKMFLNQRNN